MKAVELSALRYAELQPLVNSLDRLPLYHFTYISFHAPSSFARSQENDVVDLLKIVCQRGWNIIVHPDVIYTAEHWRCFGKSLLIENMDRRKALGRTPDELTYLFGMLPEARLCLDVAHARQQDTTLTLLKQIGSRFADRIAQIHISELDSHCQHRPMSDDAVNDYRVFAAFLESSSEVIIESMLDANRENLRMEELRLAREALGPSR